jgi:hypothetical protein
MILGLSWAAWLLIVVAVAPALVLVAAFYVAHRRSRHGSVGAASLPQERPKR